LEKKRSIYILVVAFWIMKQLSEQHIASIDIPNAVDYVPDYTVLQPRKPEYESPYSH
jgi:hypothetical protein